MNRWTKEELLAEVNKAYIKRAASGRRVTQEDIADEIGVSVTALQTYVPERLAEIAAANRWTKEELLAEVNKAYIKLSASDKPVTRQDIADEIGVSVSNLQ